MLAFKILLHGTEKRKSFDFEWKKIYTNRFHYQKAKEGPDMFKKVIRVGITDYLSDKIPNKIFDQIRK